MSDQPTYLTTRAAARRVGRSVRQIRTWRRRGLGWQVQDGLIVVEQEELLAMWRRMTLRNPIVVQKLKQLGQEIPERV